MKSSGALIGALAGGAILVGAVAFGLFWMLTSSGAPTVAETESAPSNETHGDTTPLESAKSETPTDTPTANDSKENAPPIAAGNSGNGNNSQYREPPASPEPPVWNPHPSGQGESGESIPPAGPTYDLSAEMERVHRDVSATARLPLSLFR